MDRPITFDHNDLPGIMSLWAADEYLGRYGVLAGRKIAVLSNHSLAKESCARLEAAGAEVQMLDAAEASVKGLGRKGLRAVRHNGQRYGCDSLLVSGGFTPVVHLWRHAGGKLRWDEARAAFLPAKAPEGMRAAGAANGAFALEAAIAEGKAAGLDWAEKPAASHFTLAPLWPKPGSKGRQWIDFQHDVTLKDIEIAAKENLTSVEHLKRFTTLGMAGDQGKTSNMAGLAAMAAIQGQSIPETGTTTFRPPFVPVSMALYKGPNTRQLYHPLKRLPLEARHGAAGAALGEYGGWLRPAWYGDAKSIIRDEVLMARTSAAIMDATPLGKIEVMGPDAESFVNFIYYNTIKTLKTGHIRYGFMLTEGGIVFDDGVIARLGDNRFIISCSSSHVESVGALLETWRQDGNDPDRIFVHDTTANWATVTVAGPKAREIIGALGLGLDLAPEAFPHMSFREVSFDGAPARVARVSFTGDVSFEISVPYSKAEALWQAACTTGKPLGAGPVGIEALSILHTEVANAPDRRQLVGLSLPEGATTLPTGAHLVTANPPALHRHHNL